MEEQRDGRKLVDPSCKVVRIHRFVDLHDIVSGRACNLNRRGQFDGSAAWPTPNATIASDATAASVHPPETKPQ